VIADQPIRYKAMAQRPGLSITFWLHRHCARRTS
jgi:hypothetical protein